jgi:hypothetical protein
VAVAATPRSPPETSTRRCCAAEFGRTIAADADERKVVFVTKGRDATTIARFAEHVATHKARPQQITTVSIDMSPAFIRGVADHLPQARITFDKFRVVAHASAALDQTRRLEQRRDPSLKGLRWTLLKDRQRLSAEARADFDARSAMPPPNAPPAPGSTAKDCEPSSTASRSTSCTNVLRSRPMASSKPLTASSRQPNAKPAVTPALPLCGPCSSLLPASSSSTASTLTPPSPHQIQ